MNYQAKKTVGKVYNCVTGKLNQAWCVKFKPSVQLLPGTWTRSVAKKIARLASGGD